METLTETIKNSPWGIVQCQTELCPGIISVSTARHGGIHLDREHQRLMPHYMRLGSPWYEEDCEWSMPFIVFKDEIGRAYDEAVNTLKNWFPDIYEKHFGVLIQPGESYIRDERLFKAEHAKDYIGVCAFGDWHENVPPGMVGVIATIGGIRGMASENQQIRILVPAEEYAKRNHRGFVVKVKDVTQYPAWTNDKP